MRLIMYKISDQKRVLEKLGFKYYKDTENTDYNRNIYILDNTKINIK